MYAHIYGNLTRQFKALELLHELLTEEFGLLQARDTDAIAALEFSIHELLRQVADERVSLKAAMQGTRLLEYAALLSEEQDGAAVTRLYHIIDSLEQRCARQATLNTELSLALLDQNQSLLTFLHEQITPRPAGIYSSKGRVCEDRPDAAIISGRL